MGNNFFLFECNSMQEVEKIMEGSWEWNKSPVNFNWWDPLATTIEDSEKIDSIWVKIVGLPLHLWLQTIWLETEEETTLRNHLKWARIRVHGDCHNIPREIAIENGGFLFKLQLWIESPARVIVGERDSSRTSA